MILFAKIRLLDALLQVPLPIPKDILPILSKDSEKQKAIEAKVADGVVAARQEAERKTALLKSPQPSAPSPSQSTKVATPGSSKKIAMKLSEIPPFGGPKPKPPVLPIAPTAAQNIVMSTSPTPSTTTQAANPPKLNPGASSFVFKPNPGAAVFKPVGLFPWWSWCIVVY